MVPGSFDALSAMQSQLSLGTSKGQVMDRRTFLILGAAGAALARYPVYAAESNLRTAARDAYLYTLPLVEMATVRSRLLAGGGAQNTLYGRRVLADHTSRGVTSPNNDTLYSSAWLDLSQGPVTITLPALGSRYLSLQLMDMYTNSFAVLGTRATGSEAGTFTLVGPGDALAADARNVVRAPTLRVWALLRVLVDGPADLEAARAVQGGVTITGPKVDGAQAQRIAATLATSAPWSDYFSAAARLLASEPPPATDRAMLRRIAPLGLAGDTPFTGEAFNADDKAQIEAGLAEARAFVIDPRHRGTVADGWFYPGATLGNFGQDYLARAIVARTGLAALPREEAMYMRPEGDGGDALYDGRKAWRIHFNAGQLPPVNAFWSLTMYERTPDGQSFFTDNPLKRYSIGDRTPGLAKNADGSLDLWIGHDTPGAGREANWLPAPAGPFTMTLRAYLPREALLNGNYRLPRLTPAG
jgi:hypothetical protein